METIVDSNIEFLEPDVRYGKIVFPDVDMYYHIAFSDLETRKEWINDITSISAKYFSEGKLSIRSTI